MIPALGATRRRVTLPLPPDGSLVTVPTYDGSGASIHPSVVDMGAAWNGYRWWCADTPFPNNNDQLENPSIFGTNDRVTWHVPAGLTNPLAGPPAGGFNSDTELVWDPDGQRLVCYWRDYVASRTPPMYYRIKWSTNGLAWQDADPIPVFDQPWLSPTVSRDQGGSWRMWAFSNGDQGLRLRTAASPLGPWSAGVVCPIPGYPKSWHGDIIRHNGRWIGVFADRTWAYPMASDDDGATWKVGASLGFPSYRPTLSASTKLGEMDIWSSSLDNEVHYYRRSTSLWDAI